jgi:CheY-like chemotaxis protein
MATTATILNVEDNPSARFLRTRILERAGYTVSEADTAARALDQMRTASLLLLDVNLPDGDGISICERVKVLRPELPVIMVTSVFRTAQARRDAFAAGADAYLLEPIEPERLVDTVEGFLSGRVKVATLEDTPGWIITNANGQIQDLSPAAAKLLNLSARGAIGRSLLPFFVENRPALMNQVLRAADGVIIDRRTTLQPRDRRPIVVRIDVSTMADAREGRTQLRWILERVADADPPREVV